MVRALSYVPAVVAAIACSTSGGVVSANLLQDPLPHLGESVTVCGYMIGTSNIGERRSGSRDGPGAGLSVQGSGPEILQLLRQGQDNLCLQGRIFRTGCESDPERICLEWAYEFGIDVDRVTRVSEGSAQ